MNDQHPTQSKANNKNKEYDEEKVAIGQEFTKDLQKKVDEALDGADRSLEKAIDVSNFIQIQLLSQIEMLDEVYEENKNM